MYPLKNVTAVSIFCRCAKRSEYVTIESILASESYDNKIRPGADTGRGAMPLISFVSVYILILNEEYQHVTRHIYSVAYQQHLVSSDFNVIIH